MSQTIDDILGPLCKRMRQAGIMDAPREARLIIAHILKQSYEEVYFHPDYSLSQAQLFEIATFVERRCQLEPLAKILGRKEFWGLEFIVTKDTLDPRPDSETLIEALLAHFPNKSQPLRILDLGTGSGCLMVAALTEYPYASGVAIDKSLKALLIAKTNLLTLGVHERCQLICADWTSSLTGIFDVILCNPPYIAKDEALSAQTLYDPESALFAEKGGLAAYEHLAQILPVVMEVNSYLFLEIGATQKQQVQGIFKHHGLQLFHSRWDLHGHERCLVFKK